LKNVGDQPVYVHPSGGCGFDLRMSSCAAGYENDLPWYNPCPCSCEFSGCPACGACSPGAQVLEPGKTRDVHWGGEVWVQQATCVRLQAVPAGLYQISVPVYGQPGATDMTAPHPVQVVRRTFALPAPGGVVEVELGDGDR
jgi:hypothetical protein